MSIELRGVDYIYDSGEAFEYFALRGISITIQEGAFVGIVGRTGSGKSTLITHLNGLLLPSKGAVFVDGEEVRNDRSVLASIRRKVGIVFQYPEDQFFAETVYDEISFGCRNYGFSKAQIEKNVDAAMNSVGLDTERFATLSPFQLSGGEQRRVAIASVIAMGQKYIVLDEPTAGLDSSSKLTVLTELDALRRSRNVTVILVSHNMNEVAEFCQQVIVLHEGTVAFQGPTEAFFRNAELVQKVGLEVPESYQMAGALRRHGSTWAIDERSGHRLLDSLKEAITEPGTGSR